VSRSPGDKSLVARGCPLATSPGITLSFPRLSQTRGYVAHALLPLTPVSHARYCYQTCFPRLACLIHAANVHSEPGSNPSSFCLTRRLSAGLAVARTPGFRTEESELDVAKGHDSKNSREFVRRALRRYAPLALARKGASRIVKELILDALPAGRVQTKSEPSGSEGLALLVNWSKL
jgi:hypothetical protein